MLQCGVRPLNVRLCEWLLRRVVYSPLLRGMLNGDLSEAREVSDSEPYPGTPGGGREPLKSGKVRSGEERKRRSAMNSTATRFNRR